MARTIHELASNIEAHYSHLTKKTLEVGIFNPKIAEYARFNNYGTRNIPPRPFMTTFLRSQKGAISTWVITHLDNLNFDELGTFTADRLRFYTQTYGWTPNAPVTIKRKGHSTPLVDTGDMVKSITYKVKSS